jgi:hypothetical protein
MGAKQTCKRKQTFNDLTLAHIAARQIRQKHGLSRRSRQIVVYICEHCSMLHVGTTLTDEQARAQRGVAKRWAEITANKPDAG